MSFGRYLRRARELREIPLDDVARATRIPPATLEALEGDEPLGLPEPVFVRGYVRSIAQHLGLDADDLILRWEEQTGPVNVAPAESRRLPRWAYAAGAAVLVLALWLLSQ